METNKSFNELVEKVQVNKVDSEEFLEIGEPSWKPKKKRENTL